MTEHKFMFPVLGMTCANCAINIERGVKKMEGIDDIILRSLQNALFCPISASSSNFNPRNIQYIPPVKIFAFLELEQN